MTKPKPTCDYPGCDKPILYYGFQQCYCVCDDPAHNDWGEAIEDNLMLVMDEYSEQNTDELEEL